MAEEKKETKKEETKNEVKKPEIKKEEKNSNNKETIKKETTPAKKQEKKPKTKKSKNAKWAGIVIAIIVIAIVILLTVMIAISSTPKKSVDGMLSYLKAGEFEKVQEFVDYNQLISSTNTFNTEDLNVDTQKLFFERLEWKVGKVTEENDNATIEVEITNKDFKTIISNYMQEMLKLAFSGQNLSDEQMDNYLIEDLKSEDVQMTTVTGTIQANKQEGEWKIVVDDQLLNVLLPGLQEAIDSLS